MAFFTFSYNSGGISSKLWALLACSFILFNRSSSFSEDADQLQLTPTSEQVKFFAMFFKFSNSI